MISSVANHPMDFHNYSLNQYEAQQAADLRYRQSLDTDNCWNDYGFRQFWDDVELLLNDRPELPVDPESGWVLEEILTAYKWENSAEEAVEAIADGYDPTPDTAYDFFH